MQFKRAILPGLALLTAIILGACSAPPNAASADLVAPGIFIRGLQAADRTVYTVAITKASDDAELRDLYGEIILPPGSQLVELLLPQGVELAYSAINAQGQIGLVWQESLVAADQPLEPFSFALAEPLSAELEFYLRYTDASGAPLVENFYETPPVFAASAARAEITLSGAGYVAVGETGVQLLADGRRDSLSVEVLPASYNPPEALGDFWWCSILSIEGLPPGDLLAVIVPLRRPVAPFTALQLVQQNPDGSWSVIEGEATVSADGQYASYLHPGGVIATGGPQEIRPAAVDTDEDAVEVAQIEATQAARPPQVFTLINVVTPQTLPILSDGSSNTLAFGEVAEAPTSAAPPPAPVDQPTQVPGGVTDGSSNTIIIGESTLPPAPIDQPTQVPGGITDGSSNTVITGESTLPPAPTDQPTQVPGGITDGSSNTIIIGESTLPPAPIIPPTQVPGGITDGSSNTIISGESTLPPAPINPPTQVPGGIADGSSNTIIIGESTLPPVPIIPPTQVPSGITDGSSNTIIIGEGTSQPATLVRPTQPPGGITDGSSNTIIISEATRTPAPVTVTSPPVITVTPRPVILPPSILLNAPTAQPTALPFGGGGVRVQIVAIQPGQFLQCGAGGLNCAAISRRRGGRN